MLFLWIEITVRTAECATAKPINLPYRNLYHIERGIMQLYVFIEHQFVVIVLNGNFVNLALNGSSLIVQLQFSLKIHQTCGITQYAEWFCMNCKISEQTLDAASKCF